MKKPVSISHMLGLTFPALAELKQRWHCTADSTVRISFLTIRKSDKHRELIISADTKSMPSPSSWQLFLLVLDERISAALTFQQATDQFHRS